MVYYNVLHVYIGYRFNIFNNDTGAGRVHSQCTGNVLPLDIKYLEHYLTVYSNK